jgi:hypothetical protein
MAVDLHNRFAGSSAELLVDETEFALSCRYLVYNAVCVGDHQSNSSATEPDQEKLRFRFRVKALLLPGEFA